MPRRADPERFLPLPHLWYHILLALAGGEAHGWEIIKRIREVTAEGENPSSGSLYLAMARLEDQGLIVPSGTRPRAGEDERRRYHRLTPLGRAVLEAESKRLANLVAVARKRNVLGPLRPLAQGDEP